MGLYGRSEWCSLSCLVITLWKGNKNLRKKHTARWWCGGNAKWTENWASALSVARIIIFRSLGFLTFRMRWMSLFVAFPSPCLCDNTWWKLCWNFRRFCGQMKIAHFRNWSFLWQSFLKSKLENWNSKTFHRNRKQKFHWKLSQLVDIARVMLAALLLSNKISLDYNWIQLWLWFAFKVR